MGCLRWSSNSKVEAAIKVHSLCFFTVSDTGVYFNKWFRKKVTVGHYTVFCFQARIYTHLC